MPGKLALNILCVKMIDIMSRLNKSRASVLIIILLLIIIEISLLTYSKLHAATPQKITYVPAITVPSINAYGETIHGASNSIVQIKGYGCGGIVYGSGFVVGSDLITTNAHVVSGLNTVSVIDRSGEHQGVPILFDASTDLAILRVSNLSGSPLHISLLHNPVGQQGVFLGYPGSQDFSAQPAVIEDVITSNLGLYGQKVAARDLYEIMGQIAPGSSGGPFISKVGNVIGVVVAESTTNKNTGYLVSSRELIHLLSQANNSLNRVNTGQCAQDNSHSFLAPTTPAFEAPLH